MKKRDIETIENALIGAEKHGISDTYELDNKTKLYAMYSSVGNEYEIVITGEYKEKIKFNSRETFMKFIS